MIKSFMVILIILFAFLPVRAQDTLWTRNYGLVDTTELGYCGDIVPDGGFIIGGESSKFLNGDMWLVRCDANGDTIWTRNYGAARWQMAYSVAYVSTGGFPGGFIACGEYSVGVGDYDMYVVRIDMDGDTLWTRRFGVIGENDYGREIIQTADDGFLALGQGYNDTLGTNDLFMAKIDALGNLSWTRHYGYTTGNEYGYGAKQLPDGGYIITGSFAFSSTSDLWLLRTDSAGDTLWAKRFDFHGDVDRGDDIELADDGGFVIGGRTKNAGNMRLLTMKTDSLGTMEWWHEYGNSSSDFAESIDKTSDGGYVICGGANGFPFDFFVVRINADGDSLWAATYDYDGIPGDSDDSFEIRVYPGGEIMVFGYADTHAGTGADNDCWAVKIEDGALQGSGCDYVVGDMNDSGGLNGLDVTYGVAFLKGGAAPPYECECTPLNTWYVACDVNGSCSFNGLDITYLVGYFKGGPDIVPCGDCPPAD